MRKADVYRLNRAVEGLSAAIANLEDVLRYEVSTMKNFAKLMSEEPDYQKQD